MKKINYMVALVASVFAPTAMGQFTFVIDQESANETNVMEGSAGLASAQSFTPSFSSVGFIRLWLYDGNFTDGLGATIFVNLRADSITGPLLGSTMSLALPPNHVGPADFIFETPLSVVPGVTYFFQADREPGGSGFGLSASFYGYSGGTAFFQGAPAPSKDLWFREGIVVPEPGTVGLWALGLAGWFVAARRR